MINETNDDLNKLIEILKIITEQSLVGIIIIQDGKLIYFNKRVSETFGYSIEEIKGWNLNDFIKVIHSEDREFVAEQTRKRQLADPDVIDKYKFRIIRKSGEIAWIKISTKTINYEDRTANLVLINDITDKIKSEQKLKESEEKFRNIADQSLIAISVLQDGVYKYFNEKFGEINGYSAEEIRNWAPNEFAKIVHPEDREFVMEQARKKQAGDPNVVNQYQYRIITKDGVIKWLEIFAKTINYNGHTADLAMTVDITDKVVAEQQFKESIDKYYQAYNQAEFYKDIFIHDINNILQSLFSSIQLIDMNFEEIKNNAMGGDLIDIMYRQIKRGINLISNVRKLSQLENHEICLKEVEVIEVLNRSIEFIKNSFQNKKIQFKLDTFSEKISIIGNELLQDVFENILINSVRYNKNGIIEIIIRASQVEQDDTPYCKLEFIDNGIGIEDKRKECVLTRIDLESKTTYGMGLGLSLVKKIIDNYGGKIWIEDKVKGDYSKGTKVILLIKSKVN